MSDSTISVKTLLSTRRARIPVSTLNSLVQSYQCMDTHRDAGSDTTAVKGTKSITIQCRAPTAQLSAVATKSTTVKLSNGHLSESGMFADLPAMPAHLLTKNLFAREQSTAEDVQSLTGTVSSNASVSDDEEREDSNDAITGSMSLSSSMSSSLMSSSLMSYSYVTLTNLLSSISSLGAAVRTKTLGRRRRRGPKVEAAPMPSIAEESEEELEEEEYGYTAVGDGSVFKALWLETETGGAPVITYVVVDDAEPENAKLVAFARMRLSDETLRTLTRRTDRNWTVESVSSMVGRTSAGSFGAEVELWNETADSY